MSSWSWRSEPELSVYLLRTPAPRAQRSYSRRPQPDACHLSSQLPRASARAARTRCRRPLTSVRPTYCDWSASAWPTRDRPPAGDRRRHRQDTRQQHARQAGLQSRTQAALHAVRMGLVSSNEVGAEAGATRSGWSLKQGSRRRRFAAVRPRAKNSATDRGQTAIAMNSTYTERARLASSSQKGEIGERRGSRGVVGESRSFGLMPRNDDIWPHPP